MRVILTPHSTPYFGQDFTIEYLVKTMELIPIYLKGDDYDFAEIDIEQVSLIISRYPDYEPDLRVIEAYSGFIPVAIHCHLRYNFLNTIQKKHLMRSVSLAAIHLTNCKMLNDEYAKLFPRKQWRHVNNGVDRLNFYPTDTAERATFRKRHQIDSERVLICYNGRLNNAKGLQLLKEVSKFVSISDRYHLIIQTIYHKKYDEIIGSIRKGHQNLTIYTGQDTKVVRYADLHISTSLSETTSLVTLEALFSGLPVVCTDVTGFYDELEREFASFPYFKRVSLPPAKTPSSVKAAMCIADSDIGGITFRFIDAIKQTAVLTNDQRQVLAANLQNSKFNVKNMAAELSFLYEQMEKVPLSFTLV